MKKILAVDNESEVIDTIRDTIENDAEDECKEEIELIECGNGAKALKIIDKECPDMVITAIDIDEINGMDIIKSAKKTNIPVIVLSSRTDEETVGMIVSYYKPDYYLKKPLERHELIKAIKKICSGKEERIRGIAADKIEAVLKSICDAISQTIAIIDTEFNIIWINKALEKKGFNPDNVIGRKSYQAFDNKDNPEGSPSIKALNDSTVHKETKKGADGKDYNLTSIPVTDRDGKIVYIIEFGEQIQA
jgi:DNA-binding response OmpR family regulator